MLSKIASWLITVKDLPIRFSKNPPRCGHLIVLVVIISLAAVVRIYNLGNKSLWLDEAFSVSSASGEDLLSVTRLVARKNVPHSPLYPWFLHCWMKFMAGRSEFLIRFPSALFGILTVSVIYAVATRLFDETTGLLSAMLLAVSPFHAYYSQEVRMYTLLGLATLLSTYCALRYLEHQEARLWIAFVLSSSLSLYVHPYAVFILLFLAIFVLLLVTTTSQYGGQFKSWLFAGWAVIGSFVPWLLVRLPQLLSGTARGFISWIEPPSPQNIVDILTGFFVARDVAEGFYPMAALLLAILAFGGPLSVLASKSHTRCRPLATKGLIFVLGYLAVPLVAAYSISIFLQPIILPRTLIIVLPPASILVAYGLRVMRPRVVAIALGLLLLSGASLSIRQMHFSLAKEDWRGAAQDVEAVAQAADVIVLVPSYIEPALSYYWDIENEIIEIPPDIPAELMLSSVVDRMSPPGRVWLVLRHTHFNTLETFMRQDPRFQQLIDKEFRGLQIFLFSFR